MKGSFDPQSGSDPQAGKYCSRTGLAGSQEVLMAALALWSPRNCSPAKHKMKLKCVIGVCKYETIRHSIITEVKLTAEGRQGCSLGAVRAEKRQ